MIGKLRQMLDRVAPMFHKGGRFEKYYPLFDAGDTILYTTDSVTRGATHVRDGINLKRIMILVVIGMGPLGIWAMFNTGYQAALAIAAGAVPLDTWQTALFTALGFSFDPGNVISCFVYGALYFLPIQIVVLAAGGLVEAATAVLRGHEISEGFLVTGTLIPLTLPATIPLWMVFVGTVAGVLFGKEVFGGVGMNFLNPALTVRAILFFSYPAFMSGDTPWIAANFQGVDGFTGATWLAQAAAVPGALDHASWWRAFVGLIPGSMGETSALLCFLGATVLLVTGVGSWRTMLGVTLGTLGMSLLLNAVGSDTNPAFSVPFHWHIVLGGWALGAVFMATDPVSSAHTETAKWAYGIGIGVMVVLVRVVNPAYPEGMMLAILFMNMFAPLFDYFVVRGNIKRRLARSAA